MISQEELQRVINLAEIKIGGSIIQKDSSNDIDIFGVLPDVVFCEEFLTPDNWKKLRETGNWTSGMFKFREYSIQTRELLVKRFKSSLPIDFWYVPKSYAGEINR